MKKVLILGAGLVSKPMVEYLLEEGFEVIIATRTKEKAVQNGTSYGMLRDVAAWDQNLYVAAGYFQLLKTSDGGSTWFDKLDHGGWLAGHDGRPGSSPSVPCIVGSGRILRSTDAGDTWAEATLSYADHDILDVSFPVLGLASRWETTV